MKGKQQSEEMYSLLDAIFEGVNMAQRKKGTGMSFTYKLKAIPDLKGDNDMGTPYSFNIIIRETGHGERDLQEFKFLKPKALDRYTMESKIIMSMLTIFAENAMFQWDQLGKALNIDSELQEAAKKA
jgi:hypothetical protein